MIDAVRDHLTGQVWHVVLRATAMQRRGDLVVEPSRSAEDAPPVGGPPAGGTYRLRRLPWRCRSPGEAREYGLHLLLPEGPLQLGHSAPRHTLRRRVPLREQSHRCGEAEEALPRLWN